MNKRRHGREIVLQIMYGYELNTPPKHLKDEEQQAWLNRHIDSVTELNKVTKDNPVYSYIKDIAVTTISKLETINQIISNYLDNWKIDDLTVIDKNILRLSVCEMLFHELPPAVSINEAVILAKKFGGEQSGRFINGVLDKISKRKEELLADINYV